MRNEFERSGSRSLGHYAYAPRVVAPNRPGSASAGPGFFALGNYNPLGCSPAGPLLVIGGERHQRCDPPDCHTAVEALRAVRFNLEEVRAIALRGQILRRDAEGVSKNSRNRCCAGVR